MTSPLVPTRRVLLSGAAWTAPAVAVATAAPALAASPIRTYIDQGVFVSTQYNGGYVGYQGSNFTGPTRPTSPSAYFAARAAGDNPESDINWVDGSGPTNSSMYVNGEGLFTPVTNGASAVNGTYGSMSGYWVSVPTTEAETGTQYIAGSSTTLAAGATFITEVRATVPNTSGGRWTLENIAVMSSRQVWNKQLTGTLSTLTASATYLSYANIAGRWTAFTPTITDNGDGTLTLTGRIQYVTTQPMTITQTGTKYYGQVTIMPATVQMNPSYGWNSFSLTSWVESATLSYTVPAGYVAPTTTTVSGLITTSTLTPA